MDAVRAIVKRGVTIDESFDVADLCYRHTKDGTFQVCIIDFAFAEIFISRTSPAVNEENARGLERYRMNCRGCFLAALWK